MQKRGQNSAARIFDVATGRLIRRWEKPQAWLVEALAFTPDGRFLAAGGFKGPIVIWDVVTGKESRRLISDPAASWNITYALAFSADGKTLASANPDLRPLGGRLPSASLWEMATGKERGRFEGHRADVNSVAFAPDGRTLVSGSGDTTALVWDVTGLQSQEGTEAGSTSATRNGCWRDLAGEDAAKAFKATWALTATPRETLALIRERLRPVSPVDFPRLEGLVKDLDSDRYVTRERATRELEKLGELAEPALRSALNRQPSLETRQRLESLLQKLDPIRDPESLRSLRAIEVLEHIGSAEAQTLLQQLARGAPEARLTQEAKASCVRLLNRPVNVK